MVLAVGAQKLNDETRFSAFVSYSHADAAMAKKLHRKIETYKLPKLLRTIQPAGRQDGRLGQVFRDREDLPAALNLSESVKQALAQSRALIVLCSPNAKDSPWVAKEIELFRELHPKGPILAALIEGEPEDSFPAALIQGGEPLAADLRKSGDGWRLGLLKLIAGVAEVPLDALVQRDAQRQFRSVMAVTLVVGAALLAMIGMTMFAVQQRNEAQHQQAQAEGLVEYMLTELRERLKGVGRLDIMTSVNERVVEYCEAQDKLSTLSNAGLLLCARNLHVRGLTDAQRGDMEAAFEKFTKAHRATAALLEKEPNNPDYVFIHAQSENLLGYLAYLKKDYGEAQSRTIKNKVLISKFMKTPEKKPEWVRHAGYSYGADCARLLAANDEPKAALKECSQALKYIELLTQILPNDKRAISDLANRHAWVSDAYFANRQNGEGFRHRAEQLRLVESLVEAEPKNRSWQGQWVATQMSYAELLFKHQRQLEANQYARNAHVLASELVQHEPSNIKYADWKARTAKLLN